MDVRFTQSTRRHRIGRRRVFEVMQASIGRLESRGPNLVPAVYWVGRDSRGLELEVVALLLDDTVLVIHVMPTTLRRPR